MLTRSRMSPADRAFAEKPLVGSRRTRNLARPVYRYSRAWEVAKGLALGVAFIGAGLGFLFGLILLAFAWGGANG